MATSPRYPTSEEMVVQKTKNMRVLIVGAGIGGMTLAALLKNRPFNLTLIERAPNFDHAGYMLGLWSLSKCNAGRRCRAVFLATVGCALGGVDRGRVVLLGDAAAAFLPTAGIGASMAMESAAVLADELSRTDTHFVEHALSLYVKRRRDRLERIQDDSRRLARTMFVKSPSIAHIRDLATKFYSLEGLAGSIAKAFDEPI